MPDHQQDVTAELKIVREPSGTWALWSNGGKEFIISGAVAGGVVNFLADMARHEAETRARGDVMLVQAMSQEERDVVRKLAEGWKKIEIAQYLGVSPARVSQLLAGVADAYVAYLGTPGFEYRARKQEKRKQGRQPRKLRAVA